MSVPLGAPPGESSTDAAPGAIPPPPPPPPIPGSIAGPGGGIHAPPPPGSISVPPPPSPGVVPATPPPSGGTVSQPTSPQRLMSAAPPPLQMPSAPAYTGNRESLPPPPTPMSPVGDIFGDNFPEAPNIEDLPIPDADYDGSDSNQYAVIDTGYQQNIAADADDDDAFGDSHLRHKLGEDTFGLRRTRMMSGEITESDILDPMYWTPLPLPDRANDALNLAIDYRLDTDSKFVERNAYVTGSAQYIEEAYVLSKFEEYVELGEKFSSILYTWRSCSRAVPKTDPPDSKKLDYFQAFVDISEPPVNKLRDLFHFIKEAIKYVVEDIKKICLRRRSKGDDFVSESHLVYLGRVLSMFAQLDALKNTKASVRNDFSTMYKRGLKYLHNKRNNPNLTQQQEIDDITIWLAMHNNICDDLRKDLQQITGFERLLADLISTCTSMYENGDYLLPADKFMLVKAIGMAISLIKPPANRASPEKEKDKDKEFLSLYKLDSKKKINLGKVDKIFAELRAVPLYGDMQIAPFQFVSQKDADFDSSKWSHCLSDKKAGAQANILDSIQTMREDNRKYIGNFVTRLKKLEREQKINDLNFSDSDCSDLYDLSVEGLRLASKWTTKLMEMYSWKLFHPTDRHENPNVPENAEEYEKATKYNYSSDEKTALVEAIALIKLLHRQLYKSASILTEAIKRIVNKKLQEFVVLTLREPIRKAYKSKKEMLMRLLVAIRECCADLEEDTTAADPAFKGKKDTGAFTLPKPKVRSVAPTITQLYLVRTLLECLISKGAGKKGHRKDLDKDSLAGLDQFHQLSFFWKYMINYEEILEQSCDLSQFWYREIYLEMTSGKRTQFPIEMSMPWILTSHVLESENSQTFELAFYTLDLYNDSANFALKKFKKQFLYDEVEAEVELCFEQLVYRIAKNMFAHYKEQAGSSILPRFAREKKISTSRYHVLLKRSFRLLGRSIDLKKSVSAKITQDIISCLDTAIKIFEASGFTHLMELEGLISVNRRTHHLLSQYLDLPDFDHILAEADHRVHQHQPCGRIGLHIFYELLMDVFPSFVYNGCTKRFIRADRHFQPAPERDQPPRVPMEVLWGSKSLKKAFGAIYGAYNNYIGKEHLRALCRLLGYMGMSVILKELVGVAKVMLEDQLPDCMQTVMTVFPSTCKLQRYEYGASGCLTYFKTTFKDVMSYSELKPTVWHTFRQFGNLLLFCDLADEQMALEDLSMSLHSNIFLGTIPRPLIPIKQGMEPQEVADLRMKAAKLYKAREAKFQRIFYKLVAPRLCKDQGLVCETIDEHYRERLFTKRRLFPGFLEKLKASLTAPVWRGAEPKNGVMDPNGCSAFHRFWSVMQLISCFPDKPHELINDRAIFGDGLNWAGCIIIALLGQRSQFEILDLSYHVEKVYQKRDLELAPELERMRDVQEEIPKFLERIRHIRNLNNEIFSSLNCILKSDGNEIKHYAPPDYVRPGFDSIVDAEDWDDDGYVQSESEKLRNRASSRSVTTPL